MTVPPILEVRIDGDAILQMSDNDIKRAARCLNRAHSQITPYIRSYYVVPSNHDTEKQFERLMKAMREVR